MLRFLVVLVAVAVGSAAFAQDAPAPRHKRQKVAPTEQSAADPNDITAVPSKVQKWFGGAVDDILSGAELDGKKR